MSVNQNRYLVDYGLTNPLQNIYPAPIVSKRTPTTTDYAQIGQLWIQSVNTSGVAQNMAWILTSIIANVATWNLIEASGSSGSFTTLTSTGATTLATTGTSVNTFGNTTGATSLALSVGTGGFTLNGVGASSYTIGAATTTGAISIGGTAQTGTITLGTSTAGQIVNIGTGSASVNNINIGGTGNNVIAIGNLQTGGSIALGGGMTTGTITLGNNLSGLVDIPPFIPSPVASPAATVVCNANVGYVEFTGFTTASTASQAFTITNSVVTATSGVLATAINFGTNAAFMTVVRVVPAAGSMVITLLNNGSAALNGNVAITFHVLN